MSHRSRGQSAGDPGASEKPSQLFDRISMPGNAAANPRNLVVSENARFTVLAPRLLRLEWSENGAFEDSGTYAFPQRFGPDVQYELRRKAGWLIIDTGALVLRHLPDGKAFTSENLSITLQGSQSAVWQPGESNSLNLRGTARTLDRAHRDISLEEGLLSRQGWSLFDDSDNVCYDASGWVTPRPAHALQDWYFFGYGRDYKAALSEYSQFGGKIPLVPRYALGSWWSRYWPDSADDLRGIITDFSTHRLPLDILVIDMDWHTPGTWTGYSWNRDLFPDPPQFLRWVHEQGLRATLNLHPADGVQSFEDAYESFARKMGIDPRSGAPIPFDITDQRFVRFYFELLHHPLEDDGVDFWWLDWQQGGATKMIGLDPLPWLNHLHFADATRRGERPLIFSRWGGLGNHRYPMGFSGDTVVTWDALQFQPFMTATAANVAYGWWSHDIGGHMGGATPPELFARWVQFGALSPALRLHSGNDAREERRPWTFPDDVLDASRQAFRLRYQLLPYLYTMARVATDTAVSLCRPMYYDHPHEASAYVARYQYYLGDQLIAAPIVFPADPLTGLASTDVWIPGGTWIDFQTKETFVGPRWIRIFGDIERIPLLVKAGAILPLAPIVSNSGQIPEDSLILSVYPGENGRFRFYEDDGVTEQYRNGQFEWTQLTTHLENNRKWTITIDPVEGHCPALPAWRDYEVRLEGSLSPQQVCLNGTEHTDWFYNAETLVTSIHVPRREKEERVQIVAISDRGLLALGPERNHKLMAQDVKRLLGGLEMAQELDRHQVFKLESAEELDAAARLGGPFVTHIEFANPQEAAQQLGRAIIAAPQNGQPYEAETVFTLYQSGQSAQTWTVRARPGPEATIMDTPFSWDGTGRALRWTADTSITWADRRITTSYESDTLFPTIPVWNVLVDNKQKLPVELQKLVSQQGQQNLLGNWRTQTQDVDLVRSLDDPFVVRLTDLYRERLRRGEALAAYIAVTVTTPENRESVFTFYSEGPALVYVNLEQVEEEPLEARDTECPPFFHKFTRRTGKIHLRKGANLLTVWTEPPEKLWPSLGNLPHWVFGGYFATVDGRIMSDLAFA